MCFKFFFLSRHCNYSWCVFKQVWKLRSHTVVRWRGSIEFAMSRADLPATRRKNPALISKSSHSLLNLVNVELNYKHFLIYSYSWRLQCGLPTFSIYAQVPLTAWERPGHGVHSSSVFQAEVQSTAQVSTLTLFASRTGTEAHLPSPRGEKSPLFFGGGGIENVLTQYTFNNKLWHFFLFRLPTAAPYLIFV